MTKRDWIKLGNAIGLARARLSAQKPTLQHGRAHEFWTAQLWGMNELTRAIVEHLCRESPTGFEGHAFLRLCGITWKGVNAAEERATAARERFERFGAVAP